ncbi:MAG: hypothetical protein JNL84_11785 [Candidatus Accumulibacter sp.]|nr:hypothetical protein [Accumulibacter sp.]
MKIIKTMDNKSETTVASPAQTTLTDQRRRRLVRGAAAFAPIVLTLRSGALAAASCTGATIVDIPTTGNFSAADSDVCAPEAVVCPGYPTSGPTKVLTQPTLKIQLTPTGTSEFTCNNPASGTPYTGKVAILSSVAASSLV